MTDHATSQAARRHQIDTATPEQMTVLMSEFRAERARVNAAQRERDRQTIESASRQPPQGWPEIASWVDEGTWTRVLGEAPTDLRAELESIRPPGRGPAHG